MKTGMFLCNNVNFKHKSAKHVCFHVLSSFIAYFYPHYIMMVKGLIVH